MVKDENGEIHPYHPLREGTRYIDGTVSGDLPIKRMSELFNVNTFIVSQVNPHVVPFISAGKHSLMESRLKKKMVSLAK